MYRIIMNDLIEWYEEKQDKVLLLKGAVGVGKTWVINDFANGFYKHVFYINIEKEEEAAALFKQGSEVKVDKLIAALCIYCDQIYEEGKTLFVFDEVQVNGNVVEAIMSMKRHRPELSICIIASTIGEMIYEKDYVNLLYNCFLFPMTFEEFLVANKEQELCKYIEKQKLEPIAPQYIEKITEYMKLFYITGGMPAVVSEYIKNHDLSRVDTTLRVQLNQCQEYLIQNAPEIYAEKVCKIWNSIPCQFDKENHKFMYQYVDENARAREYESSVNWLVSTGLVRKVNRVTDGITPLADQVDTKSFELYHLDHGLLRMMCDIPYDRLGDGKNLLEDVHGALIEQYVLSELTMNPSIGTLYFWVSSATAKVDFVFEDNEDIVPVTVQPQIRRKAQNMKVFRSKYDNRMSLRISMDPLSFQKSVLNVPLYGLWAF